MRIGVLLRRLINKLFRRRKRLKLGIYGPTNVGKTTLANRIALDWIGEEVGKVSHIPHETRKVQMKENIRIKSEDGRELIINLVDTPGIATKIDYEEFIKYGMKKKEALERAKEATQGVIEAIKWLDNMDVVLAVMDATKSPFNQVNLTILGNLEARNIPVIIVANKIDRKRADVERIKKAYHDGAYDSRKIFNRLDEEGIEPVIRVRKDSSLRTRGSPKRAEVVRDVKLLGYKMWSKKTGYGYRWIVESVFSAVKRMFGETLRACSRLQMTREVMMRFLLYNAVITI